MINSARRRSLLPLLIGAVATVAAMLVAPSAVAADTPAVLPATLSVSSTDVTILPAQDGYRSNVRLSLDITASTPDACTAEERCDVTIRFGCLYPFGNLQMSIYNSRTLPFTGSYLERHWDSDRFWYVTGCHAPAVAHFLFVDLHTPSVTMSRSIAYDQGDFPLHDFVRELNATVQDGDYVPNCLNLGSAHPLLGTCLEAAALPDPRLPGFHIVSAMFGGGATHEDLYRLLGRVDPPRPDEALPLLGAHGITASPDVMLGPLDQVRSLVPTLSATASAQTAEIGSVWQNAAILSGEAIALLNQSEREQVNVLVHSKGGLDARAAMWQDPELYRALGMMATPNEGSVMADILCGVTRDPQAFLLTLTPMGPCRSDADALFNLQTGYLRDVFNEEVRDWPQHAFFVAAGDCRTATEVCDLLTVVNACPPLPGPFSGPRGSDGVVCEASAFGRTGLYGDGKHFPLEPTHSLFHTAMTAECPVSQVAAALYGDRNVGNPYRTGEEPECPAPVIIAPGDGDDDGGVVAALSAPGTAAGAVTQAGPVADEDARATVQQRRDVVELPAGRPVDVVVDPEGGDVLTAQVWSAAAPDVQVLRPDGQVDTDADVMVADGFGLPLTLVSAVDLGGSARTLRLTSPVDAAVGLVTSVAPGTVDVAAEMRAAVAGTAEVTVTVRGVEPAQLQRSVLTASAATPDGVVEVAMSPVGPASGADHARTYTAQVPVLPGAWSPVDVELAGPVSRTVTVGSVVPDGTASIGGVVGDRLADQDGDGAADTLLVDVGVTVARAGTYHLGVDFTTADGEVAFSAPARAELLPGAATLTLAAPVEALVAGGHDGPYRLTDAILSEGVESRTRVAEAGEIGGIGAYPLSGLPATRLDLLGTTLTADPTTPGRLTVGVTAVVDVSGTYRLTGTVVGPEGRSLPVAETLDLDAGIHGLQAQLDTDGALPAGVYTITDLTLARDLDPTDRALGRPALMVVGALVDPTPTALTELWAAARAAGEIPSTGLFTSEAERLDRIAGLVDAGAVDQARQELGRFADHVAAARPQALATSARDRVLALVLEVDAGL